MRRAHLRARNARPKESSKKLTGASSIFDEIAQHAARYSSQTFARAAGEGSGAAGLLPRSCSSSSGSFARPTRTSRKWRKMGSLSTICCNASMCCHWSSRPSRTQKRISRLWSEHLLEPAARQARTSCASRRDACSRCRPIRGPAMSASSPMSSPT